MTQELTDSLTGRTITIAVTECDDCSKGKRRLRDGDRLGPRGRACMWQRVVPSMVEAWTSIHMSDSLLSPHETTNSSANQNRENPEEDTRRKRK